MRGAELAIRTQGNAAQAKATQHTLVEDGLIDPPPAASPSGPGHYTAATAPIPQP